MSNLPMDVVVAPTGFTDANALVNEKFDQSKTYADTAFQAAMTALEAMRTFVNSINDIDTSATITQPTLDPTTDITQYLTDAPENPITSADYAAVDALQPTGTIDYMEDMAPEFETTLANLQSKIQTILVYSSGLISLSIENAIFQRESERDALTNFDAKKKVDVDNTKRRFPLPGAGFFNAHVQVELDYQNKLLDKSRAIAEETRKIEIEAMKTTMGIADSLLGKLLSYRDKYWDRKLEAAKATLQAALEIFKAGVEVLKTKASLYETEMSGFSNYIGAVAKVVDTQVAVIRGKVEYSVAESNVNIANVKAALEQNIAKYNFTENINKTIASIAAQIAASALAAVSAAAHIQQSVTSSASSSISASESWDHPLQPNKVDRSQA